MRSIRLVQTHPPSAIRRLIARLDVITMPLSRRRFHRTSYKEKGRCLIPLILFAFAVAVFPYLIVSASDNDEAIDENEDVKKEYNFLFGPNSFEHREVLKSTGNVLGAAQ